MGSHARIRRRRRRRRRVCALQATATAMAMAMAKQTTKKPHALVISFPAQGHIGPLMELCFKLNAGVHGRDGIRITFVNDHHTHSALLQQQQQQQQQPPPPWILPHRADLPPFRMLSFHDPVRSDASTSGSDAVANILQALPAFLQPLTELCEKLAEEDPEAPFTFILADGFTPSLARGLASRFGLPLVCVWPQCACTLATLLAIAKCGHRMTQLEDAIPGVAPIAWTDMTSSLQRADPADAVFRYFVRCCDAVSEHAECVIINTCGELEEDYVERIREGLGKEDAVFTVGPLLPSWCFGEGEEAERSRASGPSSLWAEDRACLRWLDSQRESSVVYVSLGSVAILTREQFAELALGLELCQRPILWAVRRGLIDGRDAPLEFPGGYRDRMQSRLCLVAWAPQKEVLFHRSVGGFFTHHGWNSSTESLAAGVPMLGWPYFADQMTNARLCSDLWSVGLRFGGDRKRLISRDEIGEKLRSLMRPDGVIREKAERCRGIIRRAALAGGSSNLQLEKALLKVSAL